LKTPLHQLRQLPLAVWVPLLLVAAVLWGRTIQHLSVEWSIDEQYAYGWAVPALCLLMLWRHRAQFAVSAFRLLPSAFALVPLFIAARWIGEANPDWRLISAALAGLSVAISLLLVASATPAAWQAAVFPLAFFLTAVPWPTFVEHSLIQSLTRGVVATTTELLNAFGTPAIAHGNVIETATGTVDVDEACSGIRSLQVSLMLGLFFGEWRALNWRRRLALVAVAAALAWLFNLGRTFLLASITAGHGAAAAGRWHDPASIAILVGCFTGIWLAASHLARRIPAPASSLKPCGSGGESAPSDVVLKSEPAHAGCHGSGKQDADQLSTQSDPDRVAPLLRPLWPAALAALLFAGEIAVAVWYARPAPPASALWHAEPPSLLPSFREVPIPPATRKILRFDEARTGAWHEPDGTAWQLLYLRWQPGRVAVHLARNHTPEVCLPAAGRTLAEVTAIPPVRAGDVEIPFRCFTATQQGRTVYLFYTLWEDGAAAQHAESAALSWHNRWSSVLERRRNPGQRALHVAISGARDRAHAGELLRARLPALLRPGP
jgi:exosortase